LNEYNLNWYIWRKKKQTKRRNQSKN